MKKSLVAFAVLGAIASSAMAANVTLYGRIDTGLAYTHMDKDVGSAGETDTVEMTSGFSTGSRWGMKGMEELGNGYNVGFVLESGFDSNNGKSLQNDRLFGREALLSFGGNFGTIYAGRMNTLVSDGGSIGMLGATSAFGNTYGIVGTMKGSTAASFDRYDNTIAYASPKFAGFDVKAMYSFKGDDKKEATDENSADSTRYAALGLRYANGPFTGVLAADYTMWGNVGYGDVDDGYNIVLGGNYDFGVAQAFAKATYFDNQFGALDSFGLGLNKIQLEGWGLELGAKIPAAGGKILASVGYRDAKNVEDSSNKYKRINAIVGYTYPLSKRTNVYTAVGYAQEKDKANDVTPKAYQAAVGLVHKF